VDRTAFLAPAAIPLPPVQRQTSDFFLSPPAIESADPRLCRTRRKVIRDSRESFEFRQPDLKH
jgi:hypothetical protein